MRNVPESQMDGLTCIKTAKKCSMLHVRQGYSYDPTIGTTLLTDPAVLAASTALCITGHVTNGTDVRQEPTARDMKHTACYHPLSREK